VVITNSGGTTLTDNGIAKGTMTSSQGLDFTVTAVPGVNGYVILGVVPGARPTMIRFL
jgi:hypothetical protein